VTRMLPAPTVGTDEGDGDVAGDADPVRPDRGNRRVCDVAGDVAGDVGTENWQGRGARPRHRSKVPDAVTERESHSTAAVLRPSCNAGRPASSTDGRSVAVARPVVDASVAPISQVRP